MEIQDLVVEFKECISMEKCDEMVDWFETNSHLQLDGSVAGSLDGKSDNYVKFDFKKSKQSTPPPDHPISHLMTNIICDAYNTYTNIRPGPIENICSRDYSIRVYKKNDGYFKTHVDQAAGGNVTRLFAVIMYLNDVDEGGETEFPHYDIKVKPEKGKVLIFPCNYLFPHQGNVPISNDKYIATAFINYVNLSC
jgi:hypothetical protein